MKKFIIFLILMVATTSAYSQDLERSPDTTVAPYLAVGMNGTTPTPLQVDSNGKLVIDDTIDGNMVVDGNLSVTGNAEFDGSVSVGGTDERWEAETGGYIDFNDAGDDTVTLGTSAGAALKVEGLDVTANNNLTVENNLVVNGDLAVNSLDIDAKSSATNFKYDTSISQDTSDINTTLYTATDYSILFRDLTNSAWLVFDEGDDVLDSGDMEGTFTGGVPANFSIRNSVNTAQWSDDAHSGTYSLSVSGSGVSEEGVRVNLTGLTPGDHYKISFWSKVLDGTIGIIVFTDQSLSNMNSYLIADSSRWSYNSIICKVYSNGTFAFDIRRTSGTVEFLLDDMTITKVTVPEYIFGTVNYLSESSVFSANYFTDTITDGSTLFNEQVIANVTVAEDTSVFSTGDSSCRIDIDEAFTTGVAASIVTDFNTDNVVWVKFKFRSSINLGWNDLQFRLSTTADAGTATSTYAVGNTSANTWYTTEFAIISASADIISIGLVVNSDEGAMSFYIDDVSIEGNYLNVESTTNIGGKGAAKPIEIGNKIDDATFVELYHSRSLILPHITNTTGDDKDVFVNLKVIE